VLLGLAIPFFGYNFFGSTKDDKDEPVNDDITNLLKQKLIEADHLFLLNKYDDVVCLLEEYKVNVII